MLKYIYVLAFFLLISSCATTIKERDPLSTIKDAKLKEVLNKSLDAMGGYENWNNLKTLQFHKKTALYESSGDIEKATDQIHRYTFQPQNKVSINWQEADIVHEMVLENEDAKKLKNGVVDLTAKSSSLKNSIYASTFVIGIPFKLLDEGAQLSYEGTKVIPNGKEVHVVKAVYNPTVYNAHTKADIWWHYFDVQNYQQVGYAVQLHDHTSYVENLSFDRVDGFLFTTSRKSWRMDDNGNKLYLRAAYEYSKYELK